MVPKGEAGSIYSIFTHKCWPQPSGILEDGEESGSDLQPLLSRAGHGWCT